MVTVLLKGVLRCDNSKVINNKKMFWEISRHSHNNHAFISQHHQTTKINLHFQLTVSRANSRITSQRRIESWTAKDLSFALFSMKQWTFLGQGHNFKERILKKAIRKRMNIVWFRRKVVLHIGSWSLCIHIKHVYLNVICYSVRFAL